VAFWRIRAVTVLGPIVSKKKYMRFLIFLLFRQIHSAYQ
jgi:hypothetical protein